MRADPADGDRPAPPLSLGSERRRLRWAGAIVAVALAWPWVASRLLDGADAARPAVMLLVFGLTGGLGLTAWLVRRRLGLDSVPSTPVRHWLLVVAAVVLGALAATVFLVLAPGGSAADDDRTVAMMIVAAVGSSTAVPFAEELVYRGLVFQLLRTRAIGAAGRWPEGGARLRALVPAVAVSSGLFGVSHYEVASAGGIVFLAAVGAVLALVYEFTGRLWVPILIHSALNLAASLGEFDLAPVVGAGVPTAVMVCVAVWAGLYTGPPAPRGFIGSGSDAHPFGAAGRRNSR